MTKPSKQALVVFVKNTAPGQVKTRLARAVGDERAVDIYHKLVEHTYNVINEVQSKVIIAFSDYIPDQLPDLSKDISYIVQPQGDLGNRMRETLDHVLASHQYAILIGSDCPQLKKRHIDQAFEALKKNDAVIGPAEDGGYYLIGFAGVSCDVFSDMLWSTSDVLDQTLARLRSQGFKFELLDELRDVDTIEDWHRTLQDPHSFNP